MSNPRLEAALYYASLGWYIFPLAPGQKTPITPHGCKDATTDSETIREWWSKWPIANIGLACGEQTGLYAVDIDVKDGINGFDSLREFPELPRTIRQDTPRRGSHFLYKSIIAPANRNSFRPGIDVRGNGYYIVLPPSTHPNGGTYQWTVRNAPWEIQAAEFPEFLRPSSRSPWTVSNVVTPPKTIIASKSDASTSDVLLRASRYLETCDPAIQGNCGHNKLLWAAAALIHGFLLSDSDAYSLLEREYNPRCVPPWDLSTPKDKKDFERKISEARKLTPQNPEGWLLYDGAYNSDVGSGCSIDVSSILTRPKDEPKKVVQVSSDSEYAFLIKPTGLLGDICSWINRTAIKEQPFLSLACSLSFLGALFGRKVKDTLGSRTNLYCMGVAPSSAGKAHAMNQIRRLAASSGCSTLLGGDDIASDSAIEDRVYREPSTLFMWDEIGHLLAHIKSGISQHHAQVVSLLMKLYSAAGNIYLGKEYAEQQRQRIISHPCCCIYGTSTMERFTSGISPIELQDGWLSRCLVFHSPNVSPKCRGRVEVPVPQELSDSIKRWATRQIANSGTPNICTFIGPGYQQQPPTQIVVPTTPEAERIFIEFDNEAIEYGQKHQMLSCLWAKGEENARRISLIIACGEQFEQPCISASIADYSCRLIRYLLMDFSITIAPEIVTGTTDSDKRKILKVIAKSGAKGVLQCEITKATQEMRRENRNKFIDDLVEGGEIAWDKENRGKTVSRRFWTAEFYVEKLEKK